MNTDRRAAGILGLLVGDALGVPFEFHPPTRIPPENEIEMVPPTGFPRAHAGIDPGTYSDDGAQALALLDSLRACRGLDLDHFGQKLLSWRNHGEWAVDRRVFDIGIQTSTAIRRLAQGWKPTDSGPCMERDNGNGSLMRVLPIGLWFDDPHEVVRAAVRSSLPTHGHPWSLVSCALLAAWAFVIRTTPNPDPDATWWIAVKLVRDVVAPNAIPLAPAGQEPDRVLSLYVALDLVVAHVETAPISGQGFVLDSLTAARRLVCERKSYADVVRGAIALGHDTDTTAAIAGGIAGVLYGAGTGLDGDRGIPPWWISSLRGKRDVFALLRSCGWLPPERIGEET